MTVEEAKQSFLNLIQCWPLHKATLFDVNVSLIKVEGWFWCEIFSAILHLQLAQESVAGSWSARSSSSGGKEQERVDHVWVWVTDRLHPQPQPHAHNHRHRQEAKQDHCQHQPGLLHNHTLHHVLTQLIPGIPNVKSDQRVHGDHCWGSGEAASCDDKWWRCADVCWMNLTREFDSIEEHWTKLTIRTLSHETAHFRQFSWNETSFI